METSFFYLLVIFGTTQSVLAVTIGLPALEKARKVITDVQPCQKDCLQMVCCSSNHLQLLLSANPLKFSLFSGFPSIYIISFKHDIRWIIRITIPTTFLLRYASLPYIIYSIGSYVIHLPVSNSHLQSIISCLEPQGNWSKMCPCAVRCTLHTNTISYHHAQNKRAQLKQI